MERANQTIKNRLFSTINGEETWDDRLDEILHSINCSTNAVTGVSPFQIETGHAGINANDKIQHTINPRSNIEELIDNVHFRIRNEKEIRQAKFSNDNYCIFDKNTLVLAKNMVDKFPRFLGPFRIIEIRGNGSSYKIEHTTTGISLTRSGAHLKLYNKRDHADESPDETEDRSPPEPEESNDIEQPDPLDGFYFPEPDADNSDSENDESEHSEGGHEAPEHDNPEEQEPDQNEVENTEWVDGANISIYHLAESDSQEIPTNSVTLDQPESQSESQNGAIQTTTRSCNNTIPSITESAEETESEIQASDSSLIDPSSSPCQLTTNEMNMEQIDHLIEKYEVDGMKYIEGLKYDKMAAINEHFHKYHPDWPKTSNNVLVFQTDFEISREKTLGQLSRGHLLTLMSHYGIKKPRFLNTMKKSTLQSYLDGKIRKHFPAHPVHQESNELIFQPTYSTE